MKLGTYINAYEGTSTADFINRVSNTNTAALQILLYYSLHYLYKLKLS
jgi:hypothetical protein